MRKTEIVKTKIIREISLRYRKGEPYYTQRELMERFRVSYAVIGKVLKDLKSSGILDCRPRKGIYVGEIPKKSQTRNLKFSVFFFKTFSFREGSIAEIYYKTLLEAQSRYNCQIHFHLSDPDPAKMMEAYKRSSSDGIIFLESSYGRFFDMVKEQNIPYVVIHPCDGEYDFSVKIDGRHGLKEAVYALEKNGRKQVLYLKRHPFPVSSIDNSLYEAFVRTMTSLNLHHDESMLRIIDQQNIAKQVQAIREIIKKRKKYDCIFLINHFLLEMFESFLIEAGVKIPEELLIIVYGDDCYTMKAKLPLGVICRPYREATLTGIEILKESCHNRDKTQDIRLLKTNFIWKKATSTNFH